ncbi:alpha/beta fold hydrolase [Desulfocastanea catecholica]
MHNTTYFLHGLDSSGSGTKGRFFARNFPHVVCPDFTGALPERLQQLAKLVDDQRQLVLIGSSFGGLMATCYALAHPAKVARLILLAPALNFAGYQPPAQLLSTPTFLAIGEKDTVTPADLVVPLAKATFADLHLHIADDDHLLHATFPQLDWQMLLGG